MSKQVVTRFAPSPTGYLHVGGARTALFCWLWARHNNGTMILRIEDTDQKRNTPTAAKQVMDDLRWLGIDWDEGPGVGGPNGPYLQSQRKDIYDKYIKKLLDEGKAYYCFDTPAELAVMRDEAQKKKENFLYPRPERFPDKNNAAKAQAEGRQVTVRFVAHSDEPIVVTDVVRGEVTFAANEIGDFIIQKSDGFPTYHFACVVDDELMEVTHVVRGQEHLMNTPGHQLLQKALGFGIPEYAHMSVTISETGGKLSKRQRPKALHKAIKAIESADFEKIVANSKISAADFDSFLAGKTVPDMPVINAIADFLDIHLPEINVVDFRDSGYLPEALVNFIALLGWNPGDEREIMPIDELIAAFDPFRLAKSNSLFDRKKLLSFNTEYIRMLERGKLLKRFVDFLEITDSAMAGADEKLLERIVEVTAGARTLAEIEKKCEFLFIGNDEIQYDEKAVKKVLLKNDGLAILEIVGDRLAKIEAITSEGIENMLRSLAEEKQVGLGKVAQPLRVAICGTTVSPPIFDSVDMLGKENTLKRIEFTLKKFKTGS